MTWRRDCCPARGPRGAEGPRGVQGAAGPQGPVGPSEVLNFRRDGGVPIPAAVGGSVTLGAVTVQPGAWVLEGQVKLDYVPASPGSEWVDCDLKTASGEQLSRGTTRVGTDALGVASDTIPVRAAITVDVPTQVSLQCSHTTTAASGLTASQVDLQALRVGSAEQL